MRRPLSSTRYLHRMNKKKKMDASKGHALEIKQDAISTEVTLQRILPTLLSLEYVTKVAVSVAQALRVALEGSQTEYQGIARGALPRTGLHKDTAAQREKLELRVRTKSHGIDTHTQQLHSPCQERCDEEISQPSP